ncbi:MAG: hypothetical protein LBE12_14830 [Planctomycetaceae bacterium]|jgi:hypothetical protein|nr:hypothetical protein [Planctomycetaceae bacterium]
MPLTLLITMKQIFPIVFIYLVAFVFGCTPSNHPPDLPDLYPCSIIITQENQPLANALVELIPLDQTNWKWRTSAVTDMSGTAVLLTYGFPGSLPGTFKVIITKNIDDDLVYKNDDEKEKTIASYNTYSMIEKQYSRAETTPHTIEIIPNKKGTTITLDVGKAIRERL